MASIWKGSLTFGLVHIPVELRTAVRSENLSFRMLHSEDLAPVKYERVCSEDGEPVPWGEIVKGYEYEKGKFVVITDEDFETARLASSKTIDILDFVKQDEIDPRYFETPYYLTPGKGGEKPYALLREAIRSTGSIGIGKVVIRQTQHLAGVKVVDDALVLQIMRFAHELVDVDEYTFPSAENLKPQELQMAEQLIQNLAEPFEPAKYTDDYRANMMKIIRAKLKGKKVELPEPEAEPDEAEVVDLMARLQESLRQGAGRRAQRDSVRAPSKKGAASRAKKSSRSSKKSKTA